MSPRHTTFCGHQFWYVGSHRGCSRVNHVKSQLNRFKGYEPKIVILH